MPPYEVTRQINAPAAAIWDILTSVDQLVAANCSILRIDGTISQGARIRLWSEVDPKRAFPITIAVMQPHRLMEWHGGMPLGLFTGIRRFTLTESAAQTIFTMQEYYKGPLKGMMTRMIPDLQPSFEKFGNAIKTASEARR